MVGRELARDGVSLEEALDGLRPTCARWCAAATRRTTPPRALLGRLERGDARLPAPAVLRGPDDRAGQPGARAQPARRALPRQPRAPPTSATAYALVVLDADRRRPGQRRSSTPATAHPVAAARPRRRGGPHGLRRRRDRRPAGPRPGRRRRRAATSGWAPRVRLLRTLVAGLTDDRRPGVDRGPARPPTRPPRAARRARPADARAERSTRPVALTAMCGRYASSRRPEDLIEEFEVVDEPHRRARWRPTTTSRRPRRSTPSSSGRPSQGQPRAARSASCGCSRWGLVPSWAKDPSIGNRMINARMETVAEKPAFKRAFAVRRCLLPADGYFEWYPTEQTDARPASRASSPSSSGPPTAASLAMAGLYEIWRDPTRADDDPDRFRWTCTVLTTEAEDVARPHPRPDAADGRARPVGATGSTRRVADGRPAVAAGPGRARAASRPTRSSTAGQQRPQQRPRAASSRCRWRRRCS